MTEPLSPHAQRSQTRVLGIDPGLTRCGIAVVDVDGQRNVEFVHVEVVGTDSHEDHSQRIFHIFEAAQRVVSQYKPHHIGIERVFSQNNLSTGMSTAQAAAAFFIVGASFGIPCTYVTPTQVKATVTGTGSADKGGVQRMVARLLHLEALPEPADAADALAIAITVAWKNFNHPELASSSHNARLKSQGFRTRAPLTQAQAQWKSAMKKLSQSSSHQSLKKKKK